jgi:HD domain
LAVNSKPDRRCAGETPLDGPAASGPSAVTLPDALSATPATQAALEAMRAAAGSDGPMERHCVRQFAIAERLAAERAFDRELLLCACWLHDAGLFTHSRDPYVTEGARLLWPPAC